MRKLLLITSLVVLCGCASTHDFVEGSKILGSMVWGASANKHTECTYVDGHGNVCYQVADAPGQLTPEQEAEIERQVLSDIAKEEAAKASQTSI